MPTVELPPVTPLASHVASVGTLFRSAENWRLPPAGTMAVVGVTAKPSPTVTVTIAVFDVTAPGVEEPDELVDCCATAVMLTWPTCSPLPLDVVGTAAGAV